MPRLLPLTVAMAAVLVPIGRAQTFELTAPHYSIRYDTGFERDAAFARTWLDRTEQLMQSKYGVVPHGYRMSVSVLSAPGNGIDANTSGRNQCCTATSGRIKRGVISWLGLSAPIWSQQELKSSLGLPKQGEDYHAKVLVSEYVPVGYYVVQDARGGGWSFYSAPQWFVQGLEEYDAIFHSTSANRTATAGRLFDWARRNQSVFACCSPGLAIRDPYNGGATFMAFLAAEFGEDIHAKILRSAEPTFDGALQAVIGSVSMSELFARFSAWLPRASAPTN